MTISQLYISLFLIMTVYFILIMIALLLYTVAIHNAINKRK